MKIFEQKIFEVSSESEFSELALEIFHFQAEHSPVYKEYISLLGIKPESVRKIGQIPFLPVSLFKSADIITEGYKPEIIFTSSSTTGMIPAKHPVAKISLYEKSFSAGFRYFYGDPGEYAILSLLPSYLEREGSSLVYMAESLMKQSGNPANGFYLYNHSELYENLKSLKKEGTQVILLGVSFALLDFVEKFKIDFPNLTVIETGGMKGRREELTREEIHEALCTGFNTKYIHSEYGMAELLSQSYSKGDGIFQSVPWMRIIIRDTSNPFKMVGNGVRGGVNIIDLANLYSCSFIQTDDLGIKEAGDSFRILGRMENSEIRGCNLLLG